MYIYIYNHIIYYACKCLWKHLELIWIDPQNEHISLNLVDLSLVESVDNVFHRACVKTLTCNGLCQTGLSCSIKLILASQHVHIHTLNPLCKLCQFCDSHSGVPWYWRRVFLADHNWCMIFPKVPNWKQRYVSKALTHDGSSKMSVEKGAWTTRTTLCPRC